jgi:hypothetical protein
VVLSKLKDFCDKEGKEIKKYQGQGHAELTDKVGGGDDGRDDKNAHNNIPRSAQNLFPFEYIQHQEYFHKQGGLESQHSPKYKRKYIEYIGLIIKKKAYAFGYKIGIGQKTHRQGNYFEVRQIGTEHNQDKAENQKGHHDAPLPDRETRKNKFDNAKNMNRQGNDKTGDNGHLKLCDEPLGNGTDNQGFVHHAADLGELFGKNGKYFFGKTKTDNTGYDIGNQGNKYGIPQFPDMFYNGHRFFRISGSGHRQHPSKKVNNVCSDPAKHPMPGREF